MNGLATTAGSAALKAILGQKAAPKPPLPPWEVLAKGPPAAGGGSGADGGGTASGGGGPSGGAAGGSNQGPPSASTASASGTTPPGDGSGASAAASQAPPPAPEANEAAREAVPETASQSDPGATQPPGQEGGNPWASEEDEARYAAYEAKQQALKQELWHTSDPDRVRELTTQIEENAHKNRNYWQAGHFPAKDPLQGNHGFFGDEWTDPATGATMSRSAIGEVGQNWGPYHWRDVNGDGEWQRNEAETCYRASGGPYETYSKDPRFHSWVRDIRGGGNWGPNLSPGGQVCYDPVSGELSSSGSFDGHQPGSLPNWWHDRVDVAPHDTFTPTDGNGGRGAENERYDDYDQRRRRSRARN